MTQGVWPAALAPIASAIIDGATGAVIAKAGSGLGVFSKPGTGHCRVTLVGSGIENNESMAIVVVPNDTTARIATYDIDSDATPQELDIFTFDAAGVAADATRISLAVYRLSLAAPTPVPP